MRDLPPPYGAWMGILIGFLVGLFIMIAMTLVRIANDLDILAKGSR